MALRPRQRKFIEFYCGECARNVRASALKAGYSSSYADSSGIRKLIKSEEMQGYIKGLTAETDTHAVASIADIKAFWTETMNSKDCRMQDRLKSSELLAKAMGVFDRDW